MKKPIDAILLLGAVIIACLTFIGQISGHPILASWVSWGVAMKQITAWILVAHAGSSYMLLFPKERAKFKASIIVIAALNFLLAARLIYFISTLENLASYNPMASFYPAIVTTGLSVVLAMRNLSALFLRSKDLLIVLSAIPTLMGTICIAGYLFDAPRLYYFFPGYSTALALSSGVAFMLIGLCCPEPKD